jgi:hypothetical protein
VYFGPQSGCGWGDGESVGAGDHGGIATTTLDASRSQRRTNAKWTNTTALLRTVEESIRFIFDD